MFKSQILWYIIVGVVSAAIYILLSTIFSQIFLWNNHISTLVAIFLSALISYVGHYYLTFSSPGNHNKRIPAYVIQMITLVVLNAVVVEGFIKYTKAPLWIGAAIVAVIFPLINFVIYKKYIFKRK